MIKLTVMYNLPAGKDEKEFLNWRTTEHQQDNAAIPGLLKTDFYAIKSAWRLNKAPYRFMTEAYYPDMETFEKTFLAPDYQEKMTEWLKLMSDPIFLISEEVVSETMS
jgi:hypothetical protein